MSLSDAYLSLIRDEIGDADPPSDDDVRTTYDELGVASWIPTALRILRRRRSGLPGSEVKSVSLAGVVSVSLSSSLASLDTQIERLEAMLVGEQTDTTGMGGHLVRSSYR